jgi:outer membrane protein
VLTAAVDVALCNNPQIRAAWASIKIQAGAVGEARAAYLPTISATASRLRNHTAYPDSNVPDSKTTGQTRYGALSWRIFDFGGREANREAANSLLSAAMATHDATLQKTLSAVIQAYFDAQTARATVQAREQNRQIALGTLESTQRREARGVASRSDVLQAGTALAKATLESNRATGELQKAMAVLVYALGVAPQTRITLADDRKEAVVQEARNLNSWIEAAQQDHPAIRAARAQWEAAKRKVAAIRSEGLPTVDVTANYYRNGYPGQGLSPTQSRTDTVGVVLTVPIFDGFGRTYKVRGAEAQAEQRESELADTEHNVSMEIVKAHAEAMSSMQNLEASERLLNSARDSLESSQRKFDRGAADIMEILNVQAALADARLERVRCVSEWRSARLRLLASAGLLGREAASR